MIMKKTSLILLCAFGIITTSQNVSAYFVKNNKDYIESYLINLFSVGGADGYETLQFIKTADEQLYWIIITARNRVLAKLDPKTRYHSSDLARLTQQVTDEYVEQNIKNVVKSHIPSSKCADTVEYLIKERFKEVKLNSEKFRGDYTPFVGISLKDKIKRYEQSNCTTPHAPAPSAPSWHSVVHDEGKYDEPECMNCFEDFDGILQRIRFVPCGHSMCTACTKAWFFDRAHTKCPKCNQTVNKPDLRKKLYL